MNSGKNLLLNVDNVVKREKSSLYTSAVSSEEICNRFQIENIIIKLLFD